ncbi:YraN family protein [Maridesulfovibrio bastinii]|uniref:YraN family protein n=1 Tax=Maridesulfovibrio bastinii TaxID=47157 RepID=UPI00041C8E1E|nr:YraN family protein [Maridesulfovibrio bastinii]
MPAGHLKFGQAGEDYAAKYLDSHGLKVLDRNWRWRQWELDLVCMDGDELVFVEVKSRSGSGMQSGIEALTPAKCKKLVKAASHYLSEKNLWERPCRFDLVAITGNSNSMKLEHIKSAFEFSDFMGGGNTAWQPW